MKNNRACWIIDDWYNLTGAMIHAGMHLATLIDELTADEFDLEDTRAFAEFVFEAMDDPYMNPHKILTESQWKRLGAIWA